MADLTGSYISEYLDGNYFLVLDMTLLQIDKIQIKDTVNVRTAAIKS